MSGFALHHVHVRSPEPEAVCGFFTELFGAVLERTEPRDGFERHQLRLGTLLLLVDGTASGGAEGRTPGYDHIALSVTGHDQAVSRLRGKDAVFTVAPYSPKPGVKAAFVSGPGGLLVEVLEVGA